MFTRVAGGVMDLSPRITENIGAGSLLAGPNDPGVNNPQLAPRPSLVYSPGVLDPRSNWFPVPDDSVVNRDGVYPPRDLDWTFPDGTIITISPEMVRGDYLAIPQSHPIAGLVFGTFKNARIYKDASTWNGLQKLGYVSGNAPAPPPPPESTSGNIAATAKWVGIVAIVGAAFWFLPRTGG